ncbi:MAG: hypothetical protein EXR62_05590 [Chloroflexi bacterium]|nr:hypothetical protein [Chloroflexota bacterium]
MAEMPETNGTAGATERLPLMATKLYIPPARAGLVARPRLIARLDAGLAGKLILISAPAGSGKTTLLTSWRVTPIAGGLPFAWVSLDEGDNDPARFWAYVITALQGVYSGVGASALALFGSAQAPPLEVVVTALVNDLIAIATDFVLVLDDYHTIQTEAIHRALVFLLDHMPPHMRLVIASRETPPVSLARLRGRGQLVELDIADLRFTPQEAAAFLNQAMGLDLQAAQIAALEARTEGWITGLQLAALSLQGHMSMPESSSRQERAATFVAAFSGDNRYVLDYLLNEVLDQQPREVQDFLTCTSILHRLCGALCAAVMGGAPAEYSQHSAVGESAAQAMLERLEAANIFAIPLDDKRRWYRYHQLFADVLRRRLQQTLPDRVAELHRRAAAWYAQQGFAADAIDHALAGADFDMAARLVEAQAEAMQQRGEQATLLGWLAALPADVVQSRPRLCVIYAETLSLTTFDFEGMERYVQWAEDLLRQAEQNTGVRRLRGQIAARRLQDAAYRGDLPRALAQAELARQFLAPQDIHRRYDVAVRLGLAYLLSGAALAAERAYLEAGKHADLARLTAVSWGHVQFVRGQLHLARSILGDWLDISRQVWLPADGVAHLFMAEILYEWNDLAAALNHLLAAQQIFTQWNTINFLAKAHYLLARVYLAQGEADRVSESVEKLARLIPQAGLPFGQIIPGSMQAMLAHLWLTSNLAAASRWGQTLALTVQDTPDYRHLIDHLTFARLCLAQRRPEIALQFLSTLLQQAESQGRMGDAIQILALQALALRAQDNWKAAVTTLRRALALAGLEEYIRTFVDEGQPMRELLLQVRSHPRDGQLDSQEHASISIEYLDRLLAAFGATPEQASQSANLPAFKLSNLQLAEPLSARELEVLQYLAAGLSNREIAAALIVSVGTIKTHVLATFAKLDVHNRTQAVIRARELKLLD